MRKELIRGISLITSLLTVSTGILITIYSMTIGNQTIFNRLLGMGLIIISTILVTIYYVNEVSETHRRKNDE